MPASPSINPTSPITTTAELHGVCKTFASAKHIAVDTEFMRESSYYPQLCLVQLASADLAVAIDPLAKGISLAPLFTLFAKPTITKVFHAAKQDLEIFFHMAGVLPTPLYDTQIAAMVCGLGDQIGYDKLIYSTLGISIDKASRFTDWTRRPLSSQQYSYALDDVVHLTRAYPELRRRIAQAGRDEWLAEEMADLNDTSHYHTKPSEAWLRLKHRITKAEALNRLRHLAHWREETAQTRNLPRAWLMRDDTLIAIASLRPRSPNALAEIRGMSARSVKTHGGDILAALDRAEAEDKSLWPSPPRRPSKRPPQAACDLLRVLLQHKAEELGVVPRLLASQRDLETLVTRHADSRNTQADAETPLPLRGWRYQVFGKYAVQLLDGDIAMTLASTARGTGKANSKTKGKGRDNGMHIAFITPPSKTT